MRKSGWIAAAAVLAASPALAGESGSPLHDLLDLATHAPPAMQARATVMSPSVRLPGEAEDWVAAEAERQAADPRTVAQVSLAIDDALAKDIKRVSRQQRVSQMDVSMAILLQVMYVAREHVEREVKGRDDEASAARLARAEADLQAVLPLQSQTSLYLASQ